MDDLSTRDAINVKESAGAGYPVQQPNLGDTQAGGFISGDQQHASGAGLRDAGLGEEPRGDVPASQTDWQQKGG